MASFLVIYGIVALVGFVYHQYFRKKDGPSLPPGPKPLPIIGNIMDLPPQGMPEYQHWLKFKDIYGPISSITLLGQSLVIIHDRQSAHDLLEKRALKTSSRPKLHFANDWCGFGKFLISQQYDAIFRQHRKLLHQQLGTKAAATRFDDIQDVESRRFLLRVLNNPKNLIEHIKAETGAIILKITYGYSIEPDMADPLVSLIERMMVTFSLAYVPLSWLVDIFPALGYLPDGFPGTAFKEKAREWNRILMAVVNTPYSFVRKQMANGAHRPSYVSSLIQQQSGGHAENGKLNHDDEDAIKWTAAAMYGGGADTTVSTISSFILAMIMFPEVQHKAQEEIDRVTGTNRLPRFEDRERLPYIEALIKEALRWLPVLPIGPAHATDEDIIYNGHYIPKGTYLLPAIWWFLHDPQTYRDPSSFNPERYLEPRNEPDPRTEAFGYGRRICPGRYLADQNLFLTLSRILATFNISKAVDDQGRPIEAKLESMPGLISHPVAFPYNITPRSVKHVDLIRSIQVEHPWEKSDASLLEGGAINE